MSPMTPTLIQWDDSPNETELAAFWADHGEGLSIEAGGIVTAPDDAKRGGE